MSLLEQLSLLFGGSSEKAPNQVERVSRRVPIDNTTGQGKVPQVWKPNWVLGSDVSKPFQNPNVAGEKLSIPNKPSAPNWTYRMPVPAATPIPDYIPRGQQTVPHSGVPSSAGVPEVNKPMSVSKILAKGLGRIAAHPALMALDAEMLGTPEGQAWIDENRPEGWTENTLKVESELGGMSATQSDKRIEAQGKLQSEIDMLKEAGASDSLIAEREAELKSISADVDPTAEYVKGKQEELESIQFQIDQLAKSTKGNPEAFKAATASLTAKKAALEADIADASLVSEMNKKDLETLEVIHADPDNNTVIKQASTMNYDQLRADYEKMYEGEKIWEQVKKAGESAGDAAAGGHSIKDALSKASSYLGDLFGDKSIQRALIYYAGARLMGYSGSGSGMAAGQVLMQGWENETKEELALGKEKREAYAKSAEAKAVDQTKTVDFWQKGGKKKITGYMSKDGSLFYQVNDAGVLSKNPINPARQGLVTYNKTAHKTFDQLDADIKTSSVESSQDVLRTVLGNSSLDEENLRVTSDIFGDGRVVRDLTNTITRELRASGSDYNDPRIQDAINNLVSNAIWAQAEGRRTGSHQEIIKGLTGEWREHQLKHSLTGEGSIPKFVYSKVTEWGSDGKPTKIDDEFNATAPKKAIFSERLDAIRMKWVAIAEGNNVPQVEALSKITPTRITQEMAKLFKNTVMKDKNARIYWTENAVDQTAFMLWLSAPSDTEEKYMAPSSEAVKKVIGKTPSLEKLFN